MRHQISGKKLGRDIKKRKALFKSLIVNLISHGAIKTTEAKAKAVRRLVDKIVTKAKAGSLHARRQIIAFLPQKQAVKKLFEEIAPQFNERRGGFTKMSKLGSRKGDQAPMVRIEWTEDKLKIKNEKLKVSKKEKEDDKNKVDKT